MDSEADSLDPTTENDQPDSDVQKQGCLTRMTPVTPPGCASCLTTVFLILTVILAAIVFFWDPDHVPWQHTLTLWRIGLIVLLIVAIPYVIHRLVRLWVEGERSPFPDLDYAWNAGLHALATNGLSVRSLPIYLVLGSHSERQERSLFAASGIGLRVEGVPEGPAPIHWYANPDGIYICCSDASWASALASLREELMIEAASKGLSGRENVPGRSTSNPMPAASQSPTPSSTTANPGGSSDTFQGTMLLDQFLDSSAPATTEPPVEQTNSSLASETYPEDEPLLAQPMEPVVVSQQYASASLQELQYLCKLIKRIREPVCTINGVVMLLQLEAIHGTGEEMDELYKAIRGDLETVQFATQVRSPVTTLIVGLERERGFRELLRRVGQKRAIAQRFGKKFDIQTVPEPDLMANLSAHVCGAFEDWCYTLFREEKSLSHPGNTKLYELLAKVRLGWKGRLTEILTRTIAAGGSSEPAFYSGCYVAASGDTSDRQGFVRGFLEKLNDEQEYVEWTQGAIKEHKWRRRLTALGTIVCLALVACLAWMLVVTLVIN